MALIGWTTANYYSLRLDQPESIAWAIRVIFFFVIIQNMSFLLFTRTYPAPKIAMRIHYIVTYVSVSLILAVAALAGLFFRGYDWHEGNFTLNPSPLIGLFIAHAVISIGMAIRHLLRRYKGARGVLKNQLLFLLVAATILLLLVPITNFILPVALKINFFVALSPLYTLLFAAVIAYAIVRQKLFDIRLVVATSAAYALSLITLGLVYGAVIFGISDLLFGINSPQNATQQIINILLVVVLAFAFQPIKNFFNHFTNNIFYRDAYDSQSVINDVNTVLTEQLSLEPITRTTLKIICSRLKISHGQIIVINHGKIYAQEEYGHSHTLLTEEELKVFKKEVTLSEEMLAGAAKNVLEKHNLTACLKMETKNSIVGYIFLSDKQSGNIYTKQDLRLLRILSDNIAIAVENAKAYEEIRRFNITLQQKIDDATKQLRQANTKLREIDEAKDEFVSMASHQLRTPLTVIKGYLSMLLEGDMGKVTKQQKDTIQTAYDGAERMVFLIGDLLNVSRLQTGKFQIENQSTDLSAVIDHEVSHLQESAANHQLKLTYDKPKDFPKLMLDETKIRQVIMNFVDNAIYYTPAGGSIDVKLEEGAHDISFTVTDTGLGVPKSEQHHLFNKFYRAGNARKARPDGTGLGLYMAKKIIIAQGGALIFKSEEGKGSTFGFRIPKKTVQS